MEPSERYNFGGDSPGCQAYQGSGKKREGAERQGNAPTCKQTTEPEAPAASDMHLQRQLCPIGKVAPLAVDRGGTIAAEGWNASKAPLNPAW